VCGHNELLVTEVAPEIIGTADTLPNMKITQPSNILTPLEAESYALNVVPEDDD
jgi:hypothetical protein